MSIYELKSRFQNLLRPICQDLANRGVTCSLRIAEKDVPQLPEILRAHSDQASAMGQSARTLWEENFASPSIIPYLLRHVAPLLARPPSDPVANREPWITYSHLRKRLRYWLKGR